MSEIPKDVVETAERAWQPTSLECKQAIASAILAERKRCAEIASKWKGTAEDISEGETNYFRKQASSAQAFVAGGIADAINSGEQP